MDGRFSLGGAGLFAYWVFKAKLTVSPVFTSFPGPVKRSAIYHCRQTPAESAAGWEAALRAKHVLRGGCVSMASRRVWITCHLTFFRLCSIGGNGYRRRRKPGAFDLFARLYSRFPCYESPCFVPDLAEPEVAFDAADVKGAATVDHRLPPLCNGAKRLLGYCPGGGQTRSVRRFSFLPFAQSTFCAKRLRITAT